MKYLNNFLKIYFWQSSSIVLKFLSMFIVAPLITSQPAVYGVYMICMSVTIFLAYADFGFFSAANKFVCECVARNEQDQEIKILGFSGFILLPFVILYAVSICILAINPSLLIKNLTSPVDVKTASYLFLILAISSPITISGRIVTIIFGARLEDYIPQRINIITSIITICSVFYFFNANKYDIVGYSLFGQIIILIANIVIIIIARRRYDYHLFKLLKAFRFSKSVFTKTKYFAFTSFYGTICWILFFEIDLLVIARLFGADMAAYYAVALNLSTFFRTFAGSLLFAPVDTRFNQIVGLGDKEGLKRNFEKIVLLTMPIIIIPIISLCLLMKPFIYCWIGPHYSRSIFLAQLLISCYLLHFLAMPSSAVLRAYLLLKKLNYVLTLTVFIYWGGILATFSFLHLASFGIFKLLAFLISGIAYVYFSFKHLEVNLIHFFKTLFIPLIIPLLLMVGLGYPLHFYLPEIKNKLNLLLIVLLCGGISSIGFFSFYLSSSEFKSEINIMVAQLRARI